MGGWKLEVFRMALYVSFPVGLFYFFNQPSFFEEWMMEKRARIFPAQDPRSKKMLEDLKERQELQQEQMWIEEQRRSKLKQNL